MISSGPTDKGKLRVIVGRKATAPLEKAGGCVAKGVNENLKIAFGFLFF
jgi:hypothetical protein